jgi:hypothetical protein
VELPMNFTVIWRSPLGVRELLGAFLYKNIKYAFIHHHHPSVIELGHLLTRSGLTHPEVSSKVCHDSFCQLGNSVSLPWVIYHEAFYLHVVCVYFAQNMALLFEIQLPGRSDTQSMCSCLYISVGRCQMSSCGVDSASSV